MPAGCVGDLNVKDPRTFEEGGLGGAVVTGGTTAVEFTVEPLSPEVGLLLLLVVLLLFLFIFSC